MGRLRGFVGWLKLRWKQAVAVCLLLVLIGGAGAVASVHYLANLRSGRHLRRADEALRLCRYWDAREELARALRYRPGSAPLHLRAARVARQMNRLDEAEEHLRRCEELQGGQTEEQQLESLMIRAQKGDIDEVLPQLWPYVAEEKPQAPLVLEALANAYLGMARERAANECLTRWLEIEPNSVQALILEGVFAERTGNLVQASDSYRRVLELDPARPDVRLDLVVVLLGRQLFDQVIPHGNRLLRDDPDQSVVLLVLAQARRGLGELPAARECVERFLATDPDNVDGLVEASHIALDQQRNADAETYLRRALRLVPNHRLARYNLLICLTRLGKTAELPEHKKKLDAIDADYRRREKLRAELERRPRSVALLFEMGDNCMRNGLTTEGLAWLARALKIHPNHQPTHALLAKYFDEKGEHERAAAHRAKVRKQAPPKAPGR
jgi:tetratricopeptide (TPR) repeat protein